MKRTTEPQKRGEIKLFPPHLPHVSCVPVSWVVFTDTLDKDESGCDTLIISLAANVLWRPAAHDSRRSSACQYASMATTRRILKKFASLLGKERGSLQHADSPPTSPAGGKENLQVSCGM